MDDFFVRNRLSAYLDGELSVGEAREVEAALAADPALRAEYEALRRAVGLLRDHGPLRAPDGFERRLAERLGREPMPTGWRRLTRVVRPEVWAIAAVAAVALLIVAQRPEDAPVAKVPVPTVEAPVGPTPPGDALPADALGDATLGEAPVAEAPPAEDAVGDDALAAASDLTLDGEPVVGGGVLGDEGFAAARADAARKRAEGPPPGSVVLPTTGSSGKRSKSGAEREAYTPAWESDPEFTVIRGDQIVQKAAEAPAAKSASSRPPYRYRVRSPDETNLKSLAGVAASLGGSLTDENGRAVALHMLDQGEIKVVRVVVPASRVGALAQALKGLGDVETMAADPDALGSGEVPVQVELERE